MGVPPRVILSWFDSYELQEMAAYEKYAGPFDDSWGSEVLAQIHELLQQHLIVTVDANSKKPSKQKVRSVPRPYLTPEDSKEDRKKKPNVVAQLNAALDLREKHQEDGYGATYM